ncbi:MAG: ribose-5-phosphate isomerase RpiA [Anaerolineae bacterium]|nr:ribose-5-phosphate isomerase RpiA [Caldilineales bacterium]MCX7851914.1 ribose-5-phosphate isomerase RpiA [Caldilineales bacterium]MDW8268789.1 ribose-5-phosphate isomerase RpiA [Anaerolineae bacterium]
MFTNETLKTAAAARALAEIRDGMRLGLGSGSTSTIFVQLLGQAWQEGRIRDIVGVPTSEKTAALARSLGIPLRTLPEVGRLDLVVDGADEVAPDFGMIKGLGRALLREKIVAVHADHFLVIVDETKLSPRLGLSVPLPVEIVPFAAEMTVAWLAGLADRAELWCEEDGRPIVTDNGLYLARCWFDNGIADPSALARVLADRPGVAEHGLFLDMADTLIVAGRDGVRVLRRQKGATAPHTESV